MGQRGIGTNGREGDELFDEAELGDTRTRILAAAFRRIVTDGYASLSVREIAKDAGLNHALINYHFRTKDQLVIQVLDAANERLLRRQRTMYGSDEGFAAKWAHARRFYESDLASGFVRLQAELWAASFSDSELKEKFVPRLLVWKKLVYENVVVALESLKQTGVHLPSPFTAEVIACWISEFWLGMEFADLLGAPGERAQHKAALDAVEELLRSLDERATRRPTPSSRSKRAP